MNYNWTENKFDPMTGLMQSRSFIMPDIVPSVNQKLKGAANG